MILLEDHSEALTNRHDSSWVLLEPQDEPLKKAHQPKSSCYLNPPSVREDGIILRLPSQRFLPSNDYVGPHEGSRCEHGRRSRLTNTRTSGYDYVDCSGANQFDY